MQGNRVRTSFWGQVSGNSALIYKMARKSLRPRVVYLRRVRAWRGPARWSSAEIGAPAMDFSMADGRDSCGLMRLRKLSERLRRDLIIWLAEDRAVPNLSDN
jgi:hypothetical protein